MAHMIRLRGPWQYEVMHRDAPRADGGIERTTSDLPAPGTVAMPSDWSGTLGDRFHGRVCYRRRFGRPTGLEPDERVLLVIEQVDAFGSVWLNDQPLGQLDQESLPARIDVTERLETRNTLQIEVELPGPGERPRPLPRPAGRELLAGGLIGEVRLEIHQAR